MHLGKPGIYKLITETEPLTMIMKSFFYLSLAALAAIVIVNPVHDIFAADSKVYYFASKVLINGNIRNIYDLAFQKAVNITSFKESNTFMLFINTPISILPFVPFAFLTYPVFYDVWVVINTLLIGCAVFFFSKTMKIRSAVLFFLSFFIPLVSAIFTNQLTPLILLFYSLSLINFRKPVVMGIFSGLLLLKPQHIIFIPFIFLATQTWQDKRKYLQGLIPSLLLLSAINVLLYGPDVYADYGRFIQRRGESIQRWEKEEGYNIYTFTTLSRSFFRPSSIISTALSKVRV